MSNVIPFGRKPPEPVPENEGQWASGEAFCLHCEHEWAAVVPTGTTQFQCPDCGRHTGHFCFEFFPPDGTEVRVCNCGNQLFYLTREGHLCANCGVYQRY